MRALLTQPLPAALLVFGFITGVLLFLDSAELKGKFVNLAKPVLHAPASLAPEPPRLGATADTFATAPGRVAIRSELLKPLILTGTVASPDVRNRRALIGIDAQNTQTYLQGAVLADGERLVLILRDRVVLSDGSHERELATGETLSVPLDAAHHSSGAVTDVADRRGPPEPPNPDAFTEDIRPNPVFEGESLRGYEVYPGRRPDAFHRLGLQGGDVITTIDGQGMSDPQVATEMLRRLTTSSSASVMVLRRGQPLELRASAPSVMGMAPIGASQPARREIN